MLAFDRGLVTVVIVQGGCCYGGRSCGGRDVPTVRLSLGLRLGLWSELKS